MYNPMMNNYMIPFGQNYGMNLMTGFYPMYPQTYAIIYPVVVDVCNQMDTSMMTMPTQQDVDRMTEAVYDRVENLIGDEDAEMQNIKSSMGNVNEAEISQRWYGDRYGYRRPYRGLLRDLTNILILRELFRRRGWYYY